jgi:serine/threonine-protein kinase
MIGCPSRVDLQNLLAERLPAEQERLLLPHVETCPACQEILDELTAPRSATAVTGVLPPAEPSPTEESFWRGLKAALPRLPLPPDPTNSHSAGEKADEAATVLLGRYQLLEEIGRGGMGVVFRARDPSLNRPLAVKVLLEKHRGLAELEGRFLEEAQVTGQLQHPGVPPVHEVGRLEDGRPFFAMKLVQGQTLATLLRTSHNPAADRSRFLAVFGQVCQALAYAHSRGVLHRDLKPANVMVGAFGEVQVMDWGLAKVLGSARQSTLSPGPTSSTVRTLRTAMAGLSSQAGAVMGTLAYMAPEQALGQVAELDERADVFGLGAILCEILTGQPPYAARGSLEAHVQAAGADLADAFARLDHCGADTDLVRLAKACLAPDRADRPRDAGAVAAAAAAYEEGVQQRLRQAELERARAQVKEAEERKRRRLAVGLAAAGLALVSLATGGGLWFLHVQTERRTEAERQEQALRQKVDVALTQGVSLRQGFHFQQGRELLEEARQQLSLTGMDDLRQRVDRALADLHLVEQLDDARLQATTIAEGRMDFAGGRRKYAAAFAEAGLNSAGEEVTAMAARVQESTVREEIVGALDDWASLTEDPAQRAWLLEVAQQADPDPWRERLAQPELWKDRVAFTKLAQEAAEAPLSPQLATALGRALREKGGDAIPLLTAAQARFPQDFWLNFYLGAMLYRAHRLDDALGFCRAALARRPQASIVHENVGTILREKGRLDDAIGHYRQALRLDPKNHSAANNLGGALYAKGELDEAINLCRQALDINPSYGAAHNTLGVALQAKGQLDDAIDHFQQALKIDPGDTAGHNNLALVLQAKGRLDDAIDHFERALNLKPKFAEAHANLGNALKEKGQLDNAIDHYQQALQINPKLAVVHTQLGYALQAKGHLDDAIDLHQQALQIDPKLAAAHHNLGLALQAKGRLDDAIDQYRQTLELKPTHGLANGVLGEALMLQGNFTQARAALRRGLDLLPQGHSYRPTVERQLQRCERLLVLEGRLPAMLQGQDKPADAAEELEFASLCRLKRQYAAAARRYAGAFAANASFADDSNTGHRYNAACAAALAGCGRGEDAGSLDEKERARWRRQAQDWLRADLVMHAKHLESSNSPDRTAVQQRMQHWLADADLDGVRGAEAIAKLPTEEREGWTKLWADVEALRTKGQGNTK